MASIMCCIYLQAVRAFAYDVNVDVAAGDVMLSDLKGWRYRPIVIQKSVYYGSDCL